MESSLITTGEEAISAVLCPLLTTVMCMVQVAMHTEVVSTTLTLLFVFFFFFSIQIRRYCYV